VVQRSRPVTGDAVIRIWGSNSRIGQARILAVVRLLRVTAAGLLLTLAAAGCSSSAPASNRFETPQPSPATSSKASVPATAPSPSKAASISYTFPVVGKSDYARDHHDYPASDILAACGSRVVAVTSGKVLAVTLVDKWKRSVNAGDTRGGLSVSILGDDGVRYYGSHMSAIDDSVRPGARVTGGHAIGKVGETGDASACHLHFGISPPCAGQGDWYTQRGTIWPWRYLDSWRKDGHKSPVAEVTAWHQKHGCPKKPTVDP
jgi:murein DD-endopeptidase MepM/ murein hydrolase activator NlpD